MEAGCSDVEAKGVQNGGGQGRQERQGGAGAMAAKESGAEGEAARQRRDGVAVSLPARCAQADLRKFLTGHR